MKSIKSVLVLTAALGLSLPALAAPRLPSEATAPGAATQALLDLQKSGQASVAAPQPMSGEVAERVYQRYLKSYEHAIPEQFTRESFSGGSGSR